MKIKTVNTKRAGGCLEAPSAPVSSGENSMHVVKLYFLAVVLLMGGIASAASAGSMQVSPTSLVTGKAVTVTMTQEYESDIPTVQFNIDFGDGTSPVRSTTYSGPGVYRYTATHVYKTAGQFTITGKVLCARQRTFTERVSVFESIGALPTGMVGEKYAHQLVSSGAAHSYGFRLQGGRLPTGLTLDRKGRLQGIPLRQGRFAFTVQMTNGAGISSTQNLSLRIAPCPLVMAVSPENINMTRGRGRSQRITFSVVTPEASLSEIIRSTRGEFLAGGRVLGAIATPLSINLQRPHSSVTETVMIPQNILLAAQQVASRQLVYRRVFTGQNVQSATRAVTISLKTAAAGALKITSLRLYFEQNRRSTILVEKETKALTGVAEVRFDGSGMLKGYWQVDGRILSRVQQNVFYGKTLVVKTPTIPPLPTYAEGAHSLKFVITEPVDAGKSAFSEALYHVEPGKAKPLVPVALQSPESGAELGSAELQFIWDGRHGAATYLIEFLRQGDDRPFFSAYTKKASYTLPVRILSLKFETGGQYRWRVRGFNVDRDLVGRSPEWSFGLLTN